MNDKAEIVTINNEPKKVSLVAKIADKYSVDSDKMMATLKSTAFSQGNNAAPVTNEQMMALLIVADQYNLNPFTKEIYAFPAGGAIQPIVSIDGWLKLINSNPAFDGMEFVDVKEDSGTLISVTCKIYRKDRSHPVEVTEYMAECYKKTITWDKWPARMLRHKATIQAARYAFNFAGIVDPDEGDRIVEAEEMKEVYEIPYTEAEKIEFDRLFNGDDTLAFYLFLQSISRETYIALFNSFPAKVRGSDVPGKTECKDRAREMEASGQDKFSAYYDELIAHIDNDDSSGVLEVISELRALGFEIAYEKLSPDHQFKVNSMREEA